MCIQRKKAEDSGLRFYATYTNIHDGNSDVQEGLHSPIVVADEQRIQQVLLNLQSNALKFTEKGKVEVRVTIVDDEFLEVKVIDSGIGIK